MTDKTGGAAFHWYAPSDAERYTIGPCDTRDQAIAEATGEELGWLELFDGTYQRATASLARTALEGVKG